MIPSNRVSMTSAIQHVSRVPLNSPKKIHSDFRRETPPLYNAGVIEPLISQSLYTVVFKPFFYGFVVFRSDCFLDRGWDFSRRLMLYKFWNFRSWKSSSTIKTKTIDVKRSCSFFKKKIQVNFFFAPTCVWSHIKKN